MGSSRKCFAGRSEIGHGWCLMGRYLTYSKVKKNPSSSWYSDFVEYQCQHQGLCNEGTFDEATENKTKNAGQGGAYKLPKQGYRFAAHFPHLETSRRVMSHMIIMVISTQARPSRCYILDDIKGLHETILSIGHNCKCFAFKKLGLLRIFSSSTSRARCIYNRSQCVSTMSS